MPDISDLQDCFFERAKTGVTNPSAVTQTISDTALNEAVAEVGSDIAEHLLFDVAMLRLKINMKIPLTEDDWHLMRNAKKESLKQTAITEGVSSIVVVVQRASEWDM